MKRYFLLICLTFLYFPVFGAPTTLNPTVSRADWTAKVQKNLPVLLCDPDRYFVQCYKVTQGECIDFTSKIIKGCLKNANAKIPEKLTDEQGKYWGQVMGRCSDALYEKFMASKKQKTQQCTTLPKASPK